MPPLAVTQHLQKSQFFWQENTPSIASYSLARYIQWSLKRGVSLARRERNTISPTPIEELVEYVPNHRRKPLESC